MSFKQQNNKVKLTIYNYTYTETTAQVVFLAYTSLLFY